MGISDFELGDLLDDGENGTTTTVSEESFCSTFTCSIVGFFVILAGTAGHFYNEKLAVERLELYDHAELTAVTMNSGSSAKFDDFKGSLVHLNSKINIESPFLRDEQFDVQVQCVRLNREVKMYQTCEEKHTKSKERNGKTYTETWYTYENKWRSSSCACSDRGHCDNPVFGLEQPQWASEVTVNTDIGQSEDDNKIKLSDSYTSQISWENRDSNVQRVLREQHLQHDLSAANGRLDIGDYKVKWSCIGRDGDEVSLLGELNQDGDEMVSYVTTLRVLWSKFETTPLADLDQGTLTLSEMITNLRSESETITWILRAVLFLAIIGGSIAFWGPLSYLLEKIPCVGDFIAGIVDFVAGVSGFVWSFFICVLCWCLVRPWLLVSFVIVLAVSIGGVVLYKKLKPKKGEEPTKGEL